MDIPNFLTPLLYVSESYSWYYPLAFAVLVICIILCSTVLFVMGGKEDKSEEILSDGLTNAQWSSRGGLEHGMLKLINLVYLLISILEHVPYDYCCPIQPILLFLHPPYDHHCEETDYFKNNTSLVKVKVTLPFYDFEIFFW